MLETLLTIILVVWVVFILVLLCAVSMLWVILVKYVLSESVKGTWYDKVLSYPFFLIARWI